MTTDNRTNELTPNPTAEQIVWEVLRHAVVASGETLEQWTGAVVWELCAHGLLSEGALSEEQVEVAAVASINSHRSRAGLPTLATLDGVPNADEWRDDARAALVAAQGAAPVLPSSGVDEDKLAEVERDAALARIAEAAKLHRPKSSLTWGAPMEFLVCEECDDPDAREFEYWPCPTAVSLGLGEGENTDV